MTQEVIVYRSPVEKAFYDALMAGDLFILLVSILVFIITVFFLESMLSNLKSSLFAKRYKCSLFLHRVLFFRYTSIILSGLITYIVIKLL